MADRTKNQKNSMFECELPLCPGQVAVPKPIINALKATKKRDIKVDFDDESAKKEEEKYWNERKKTKQNRSSEPDHKKVRGKGKMTGKRQY